MTLKKNWPIYVASVPYALMVATALYFGWKNDQERWPDESKPAIVREVCYDRNTEEEVRLTPLDYQQIQSRAGRGFDGLWPNLECKLVER